MISLLFPILAPFSFLQTNFWDSKTRITQVQQPILFIRSLKDELVPTEQMLQLMEFAINAKYKRYHEIPNGTHNMGW